MLSVSICPSTALDSITVPLIGLYVADVNLLILYCILDTFLCAVSNVFCCFFIEFAVVTSFVLFCPFSKFNFAFCNDNSAVCNDNSVVVLSFSVCVNVSKAF